MLKILMIADVAFILGLSYCVVQRTALRRHADRITYLALRVSGLSLLAAFILLAGKLPGSVQLTTTLECVTRWLHS
jgi:hypothetical protein